MEGLYFLYKPLKRNRFAKTITTKGLMHNAKPNLTSEPSVVLAKVKIIAKEISDLLDVSILSRLAFDLLSLQ